MNLEAGSSADESVKAAIEISKPKEREDGGVFLIIEGTVYDYCLDTCNINS